MNKHFTFFVVLAVVSVFISCNKEDKVSVSSEPQEIILACEGDGMDMEVQTKATAITSVPATLYWGASTGSAGSETQKWAAASASTSSNQIKTGKYQTASPTAYNFYVANQSFSIAASATTMTVANNNTDILSARVSSSSTAVTMNLGHIFARTGTLTLNPQDGYSLSNVSWKIVGASDINGTAGTYNMTTGTWTSSSAKITSQTAITSSSDMYLIPGTYTIYVTYTLTKGDYVATFTKHGNVTLEQGKVNSITGTAIGGTANEIVLTCSVTAWGSANQTLTLS